MLATPSTADGTAPDHQADRAAALHDRIAVGCPSTARSVAGHAVPFPSKRHRNTSLAQLSVDSAAVGVAASAAGAVTTGGGPSAQDAQAGQDVNADAALTVATIATRATVAAKAEHGHDSTCGE
ncbi:MAG: hypothetical protein WBL53_14620, partial [Pseudonocardiaceae bacterium]